MPIPKKVGFRIGDLVDQAVLGQKFDRIDRTNIAWHPKPPRKITVRATGSPAVYTNACVNLTQKNNVAAIAVFEFVAFNNSAIRTSGAKTTRFSTAFR